MLRILNHLIFIQTYPFTGVIQKTLVLCFLLALYLGGLIHWTIFLNFGGLPFSDTTTDWPAQFGYYLTLKAILKEAVIPYSVSGMPGPAGDAFFANPEVTMSPQILLLNFMSIGPFVLLNTLFVYTLGFTGCIALGIKYRLSTVPFTILFLLFNFNGHITSHISMGHSMWSGYFLLPFVFFFIMQLFESDNKDKTFPSLLLSLTLFGIVLQGSFHIYIWCLTFMSLLAIFNPDRWKILLLTMLYSGWLSIFRILPAGLMLNDYRASYASGFPTIGTLVDSLTTIKAFTYEHVRIQGPGSLYDVGWWEHNHFIGYIGVAFILFFGIYQQYIRKPKQLEPFKYLGLPLLVITLFSFGLWFDILSDLKIPLLSWVERVPSRFFIIPLLTLILLSCIQCQNMIRTAQFTITFKILALFALIQMAHSLIAHSWFWKLNGGSSKIEESHYLENIYINSYEQSSILYTQIVNISLILSALGVIYVLYSILNKSRTRKNRS